MLLNGVPASGVLPRARVDIHSSGVSCSGPCRSYCGADAHLLTLALYASRNQSWLDVIAGLSVQEPSESGAEHLAAFQGLTRLEIGYQGAQVDAFEAVAQLTRLQRLRLRYANAPLPPHVRLRQLSTLGRLTSLEGLGESFAL